MISAKNSWKLCELYIFSIICLSFRHQRNSENSHRNKKRSLFIFLPWSVVWFYLLSSRSLFFVFLPLPLTALCAFLSHKVSYRHLLVQRDRSPKIPPQCRAVTWPLPAGSSHGVPVWSLQAILSDYSEKKGCLTHRRLEAWSQGSRLVWDLYMVPSLASYVRRDKSIICSLTGGQVMHSFIRQCLRLLQQYPLCYRSILSLCYR